MDCFEVGFPFEKRCCSFDLTLVVENDRICVDPFEYKDRYFPEECEYTEAERQQLVSAELLIERNVDNQENEWYYDSSKDESDLFSFPRVTEDPEEKKAT